MACGKRSLAQKTVIRSKKERRVSESESPIILGSKRANNLVANLMPQESGVRIQLQK